MAATRPETKYTGDPGDCKSPQNVKESVAVDPFSFLQPELCQHLQSALMSLVKFLAPVDTQPANMLTAARGLSKAILKSELKTPEVTAMMHLLKKLDSGDLLSVPSDEQEVLAHLGGGTACYALHWQSLALH
ncbi:hypothetical protein WJX77_005239 [Trebouxia sp. C0004]